MADRENKKCRTIQSSSKKTLVTIWADSFKATGGNDATLNYTI